MNIGQSLTDLIKQGTDQINEENIKKGPAENSQLADLSGLASSGLEKSEEGFNKGVEKVRGMVNDANEILTKAKEDVGEWIEDATEILAKGKKDVGELVEDANDILAKGEEDVGEWIEVVNEKMPEDKEKADGFGSRIFNTFKSFFGVN